ncbi:MAG: hypothetical protein AAF086_09155, partial [Planctomycetota bacterium]
VAALDQTASVLEGAGHHVEMASPQYDPDQFNEANFLAPETIPAVPRPPRRLRSRVVCLDFSRSPRPTPSFTCSCCPRS